MTYSYLSSALGGIIIGVSSLTFLLLNGRVAGISGIVGGLMTGLSERLVTNILFVAGLMLGPIAFRILSGAWPIVHVGGSIALLVVAGLLVGFGTRLGSGCTSGHGVSGLARLSPRSFAAVATFLATGVITVLVMRMIAA